MRQPSGEQLLADVEAWLLVEYPDAVRRTHLRPTGDDQAQLTVALHPAAPDLRMLAWDNGRVDVVAETVTARPGYHRFVGRVLDDWGSSSRFRGRATTRSTSRSASDRLSSRPT